MEQVLDWLNENENRAYPLLEESNNRNFKLFDNTYWLMPDNFILDAQLIYLKDKLNAPVIIKKIASSSTLGVEVVFGTQVSNIAKFNISLATLASAEFPLYVRKSSGSLAVFGEGILDFFNLCGDREVELYPNAPLEPGVCFELNEPWLGVNSIQVSPEKLSNLNSVSVFRPLLDVGLPTSAVGDVKFLEGYHFNVVVRSGLVDLAVGRDYGIPIDCSTSFLLEKYLDCSSIISYINGIPPTDNGDFTIFAGANITITPGNIAGNFEDPFLESAQNNTLFIGLNFKAEEICKPVNIIPSLV
jgi:hypothetical protein